MNKQIVSTVIASVVLSLVATVIVASLFLSGQQATAPATTDQNVAGSVNTIDVTGANATFSGCIASNGITECTKKLTISPTSNGLSYAYWDNTTGKDFYVTQGTMITSGTASTSVNLFLFATTSRTTLTGAEHYTVPTVAVQKRIVYRSFVATSTAATTTSSWIEAQNNALSVNTSGGIVKVPNNSRVYFWVQNAAVTAGTTGTPASLCSFNATVSSCDTATSTNLGIYPAYAVFKGFFLTPTALSPGQL